jgi:hypothetical protein
VLAGQPTRSSLHALLLLSAACAAEQPVPASPATSATRVPTTSGPTKSYATPLSELGAPAHELVIRYLLADDSVIPKRPPVHPVRALYNPEAVIPPMCYTRTEGHNNPCYVCHQDQIPGRLNTMNDADLQAAYSFSDLGRTNHYRNLFVDRIQSTKAISDAEIDAWVAVDNYSALAGRLTAAGFRGYIPDLADLASGPAAFDALGFAKDGSGWVAFNYKPLPSTFWPTNGATDDVMIRLPEPFRRTSSGEESRDVYLANLAILEANIKGLARVDVPLIDERTAECYLDGNGQLGLAREVKTPARYVGAAHDQIKVQYLYPVGTEFLHSVRYLGVDSDGAIYVPPRMKELRYMQKRFFKSRDQLAEEYRREGYAKDAGELPGYVDRGQYGLDNDMGWVIAGFIENKQGQLRVQGFEENLFCMGCHTSIGSTIDSVFSFARKVDGAAGLGYIDLHGMPDAPNVGEVEGEILTYLQRAGGGGEFRSNPEMEARYFSGGKLVVSKVNQARDVYELITPSPERARALNKAYLLLVREQSYLYGRDASLTPPANVYAEVDNENAPTLPVERNFRWDMRLDWSAVDQARAPARKHAAGPAATAAN